MTIASNLSGASPRAEIATQRPVRRGSTRSMLPLVSIRRPSVIGRSTSFEKYATFCSCPSSSILKSSCFRFEMMPVLLVAHGSEDIDEVDLHAQRLLALPLLSTLALLSRLLITGVLPARSAGCCCLRRRESGQSKNGSARQPECENTRREGGQTHCIISLSAISDSRFEQEFSLVRCNSRATGCLARTAAPRERNQILAAAVHSEKAGYSDDATSNAEPSESNHAGASHDSDRVCARRRRPRRYYRSLRRRPQHPRARPVSTEWPTNRPAAGQPATRLATARLKPPPTSPNTPPDQPAPNQQPGQRAQTPAPPPHKTEHPTTRAITSVCTPKSSSSPSPSRLATAG